MEYKGRALRHELKYIISTTEYEALKARLSATMPRDVHSGPSGYHIRSLYFVKSTVCVFTTKATV